AAELGGDGYAVILLQAGDVGDKGARVGVDDLDLGAVGEIDAAGGGVYGDVVEVLAGGAFRRAEGVFLEQVIGARGGAGDRDGGEKSEQCGNCDSAEAVSGHVVLPGDGMAFGSDEVRLPVTSIRR